MMSLHQSSSRAAASDVCDQHDKSGLRELIEAIVTNADRDALHQLLEKRPVFFKGDNSRALLTDYIHFLYLRGNGGSAKVATQVLDKAHDLTLDKFSNLVDDKKVCAGVKRSGPSCRYYYAAFLEWREKVDSGPDGGGETEREYRDAWSLQRFVARHFYLSLLEARRSINPTVSRYTWNVDGKGAVTVWLPKTLGGSERRQWLENNVDLPDPSRPGERERIQALVDARLARGGLIPLENIDGTLACATTDAHPHFEGRTPFSLPEFVAREKAMSIDLQRPAIAALGKRALERLVLDIFENLDGREKPDEDIARKYGLSKAALSRFAGSTWPRNGDSTNTPDLWRNTAHVLSTVPEFIDVAERAGVAKCAKTIAVRREPLRLRGSYEHT